MKIHLISYDLIRPEKDYPRLIEHIKSYGTWAKPLESVWLIETARSAEQVRDGARAHMDGNDKVLVIEVSGSAAWANLPQEVSDWLKNNI